jgi:glyoxylase-like metal-dependent hydrolase (beta-lactamase superfamily II)
VSLPPAVPGAPEGPWRGGRLSDRVTCVLAPNPGPMTLDGTNTYLLSEPSSSHAVVVDPGPDDGAHLDAVAAALASSGRRAALVLLTHGHADHSAGAGALARRLGCPVRAVDPRHRTGADGLGDGDRLVVGGLHIEVVATPGHTSDSISLVLPAERAVMTGDTVLGRGTTVVAHPDGRLADYLASLDRLARLADRTPDLTLLPGHGPAGAPVSGVVAFYQAHRAARLDQVVAAVAAGAGDVDAVVADVYAEVARMLWPAARLSVQAQLDHLVQTGRLDEVKGSLQVSGRDA